MDLQTINSEVTMSGENATVLAGRYRIVRQLGQGGMGSVWLAEDEKLDGLKVAIKMLPSVLVNNKRAYAQVKAEALVSLKLSHPNIVTVRAFEEEGGTPFLVMDYIDGQTLDDYLAEKGKLTEEETVRLLKPVAAALDYAHTQGVVHRDVKPGNVMIRKDGTPFVLDFGIAREIQETMTRVTGKLSSGTLLYMSPEQLNGDAPKPAQDVYSFSAMAYECLRGEPPFSRGGIEDQIKHKTPEALSGHNAICRGVMAGLGKVPSSRPKTCAAVVEAEVEQSRQKQPRPQPLASGTATLLEQDMRVVLPEERQCFDDLPRRESRAHEKSDFASQENVVRHDYRPTDTSGKHSTSGVSYGWLALVAVVLSGIAIWLIWQKDHSKDTEGRRMQSSRPLSSSMSTVGVPKQAPSSKPIESESSSVCVTASLNGIPRQATFVSGLERSGAVTPLTVNLQNLVGQKWSCKLRYVVDGIVYEGEGSCVATPGRQTLDVKLQSAVPLYDRPATMNFCRHCRAPLSSYSKVPRNCPKCGKNLFGQ